MPFNPDSTVLPVLAKDVSFSVGGRRTIKGVSLELAAGPVSVILGFNGAGKTTLLRLLHGLLPPSAGTIRWGNTRGGKSAIRQQAMVFQRPALLRRSVAANVAYPLKVAGVGRAEMTERVEAALELARLQGRAGQPAGSLSGGEQQRLALARALVTEPELVFLDEPTASLDPASVDRVERMLNDARERGVTIVLVSQSIGQARRLADQIIFLHRGRLLEHAPASSFFTAPGSPVAEAFLAGGLPPAYPRASSESLLPEAIVE